MIFRFPVAVFSFHIQSCRISVEETCCFDFFIAEVALSLHLTRSRAASHSESGTQTSDMDDSGLSISERMRAESLWLFFSFLSSSVLGQSPKRFVFVFPVDRSRPFTVRPRVRVHAENLIVVRLDGILRHWRPLPYGGAPPRALWMNVSPF